MKCRSCKRELIVRSHVTKEYRNDAGHVYKTRRSPVYHRCACRGAESSKSGRVRGPIEPERVLALVADAAQHDQSPEDAERELAADGVDVRGFAARTCEAVERARAVAGGGPPVASSRSPNPGLPPVRLTRQGVRDLDPRGHNGHVDRGTPADRCAHVWLDQAVVGQERAGTWMTETPVYGQRCASCKEVRR